MEEPRLEERERVQVFAKGAVPEGRAWSMYRKKVLTKAVRIFGPFLVHTSEGTLRCNDGWLCLDVRGNPYPVAAEEFELSHAPALVDFSPPPSGPPPSEP